MGDDPKSKKKKKPVVEVTDWGEEVSTTPSVVQEVADWGEAVSTTPEKKNSDGGNGLAVGPDGQLQPSVPGTSPLPSPNGNGHAQPPIPLSPPSPTAKGGTNFLDNPALNPFTANGTSLDINGTKLPLVNPTPLGNSPEQINDLMGRVVRKIATPTDIQTLATATGKQASSVQAYVNGDKDLGDNIEIATKKLKDNQSLVAGVQNMNALLGTNIDPNEILSSADKSSQLLSSIKQVNENSLKAKDAANIRKEYLGGDVVMPKPTEDQKKADAELDQRNQYAEALSSHVVDKTVEEDRQNGVPKEETIKKIFKRLDPRGYDQNQKASQPEVSISKMFLGGKAEDLLTGNDQEKTDLLNSQRGIAEQLYNNGLENLGLQTRAQGIISKDEKMVQDGENMLSQVDYNVEDNYPSLIKQRIASQVNDYINQQSGVLKDGEVKDHSEYAFGASTGDRLDAMKKLGLLDNPKTKDLALSMADHSTYFQNNSVLGGIVPSFLQPLSDLGMSIGDITGLRNNRDITASKIHDELFPKELPAEELKSQVSIPRTILNTTANLAGMLAIATATEGLGSAAGVSGAVARSLGAYTSFGLPAFDASLKDAKNFIDSEPAQYVYAGLNAIANAEGGRLLDLGRITRIPGVSDQLAHIANKISVNDITEGAAKELLDKKVVPKYIEFAMKYGKNVTHGAATMAAFNIKDNILRSAFGDPSAAENLLPQAGHAFVDGVLGMSIMGVFGAAKDMKTEKNTIYKGAIYQLALNHDAAQDVLKMGLLSGQYTPEAFAEKMQILNTARVHKNTVDLNEKRTGIELTQDQKAVYVANKTAASVLRQKSEEVGLPEETKNKYLEQAARLEQQSTQTLDGLKFTPTLQPLQELFEAEKAYNEALDNLIPGDEASEKAFGKARDVYAPLYDAYKKSQEPEIKPTTASVPTMITKVMEADLKAAGYSQADIDKMKPAEAHDILQNGTKKEADTDLEKSAAEKFGKLKSKKQPKVYSDAELRDIADQSFGRLRDPEGNITFHELGGASTRGSLITLHGEEIVAKAEKQFPLETALSVSIVDNQNKVVSDNNGNPITFYHATNRKGIAELEPNTAKQFGKGIYFASDKESVSDLGDNVFEVHLPDKLLKVGEKEHGEIMEKVENESGLQWDDEDFPLEKVNDEVKKRGYKGLIMDNDVYGGKEAMIFDKKDVIYKLPVEEVKPSIAKKESVVDNPDLKNVENTIKALEDLSNTDPDAINKILEDFANDYSIASLAKQVVDASGKKFVRATDEQMQRVKEAKSPSALLDLIIKTTTDPKLKAVAQVLRANIHKAPFLKFKIGTPVDRSGYPAGGDVNASYGGGRVTVAEHVFWRRTNNFHSNGLDGGYKTILHEFVHAFTLDAYRKPKTPAERKFKEYIDKVYKDLKSNSEFADSYGFKSPEEFISEVMTNPEFRLSAPIYKSGILDRIIEYVAKIFGYSKDKNLASDVRHGQVNEAFDFILKKIPEIRAGEGKKIFYDKADNLRRLAEAYHKAKAAGSNPELVKAVEDALSPAKKEEVNPSITLKDGTNLTLERKELGVDRNEKGYSNYFEVAAKDTDGKDIGYAKFDTNEDGTIFPIFIDTKKDFQRKGVMSGIYKNLEDNGYKIVEGKNSKSEEGAAFEKSRKEEVKPSIDLNREKVLVEMKNIAKNDVESQEQYRKRKENLLDAIVEGKVDGEKYNVSKEAIGKLKSTTENKVEVSDKPAISEKDFTAKGGNKVVDKNGEPIVVYHGTSENFDSFSKEAKSKSNHPSSKLGIFFTVSERLANLFNRDTEGVGGFPDVSRLPEKKGARVIKAFLDIKNPKVLSKMEYQDLMVTPDYSRTTTGEDYAALRKKYMDEGYDGIKIENDFFNEMGEYSADQYIAFDPSQIKIIKETPELKSETKPPIENNAEKVSDKPAIEKENKSEKAVDLQHEPIIADDKAENDRAVLQLTDKDNIEQEPGIKVIEGKAESSVKTTLNEVVVDANSLIAKATGVTNIPVSELATDEASFQNREGLNEKKVQQIVDNYNPSAFDPIQYWTDQNGQKFTLNHHRFEAAKRMGLSEIPARALTYSKEHPKAGEIVPPSDKAEAIRFAKEESNVNRSMETPLERAKILKEKRDRGDNDIPGFLEQEGRNKTFIENLSYLNPKGKAVDAIKQFNESPDKQTQKETEKIADWIGEARKRNPALTDAHENEMFAYLKDENNRITNKNDFVDKVNKASFGLHDGEPLNLKSVVDKSDNRIEWDQKKEELQKTVNDLKRIVTPDKKTGWTGLKKEYVSKLAQRFGGDAEKGLAEFKNPENQKIYAENLNKNRLLLKSALDKLGIHLAKENDLIQGDKSQQNLFNEQSETYTAKEEGTQQEIPYRSFATDDYPASSGDIQQTKDQPSNLGSTVRGIWSKVKDLQFSGKTKVKSHADVAHIMRLLENKSVEHGFAVHINKAGKAFIQFLSIGGRTGTVVDPRDVLAGAKKHKAAETFLVHNHPSGNLKPSNADIALTDKIRSGFRDLGIKVQHIIMDTFKGDYTLIDHTGDELQFSRDKFSETSNTKIKSEKFDAQEALTKPLSEKIKGSQDVAATIHQFRFSALPKRAVLLLNQANEIIANHVIREYKDAAELAAETPTATNVIFYGNEYNLNAVKEAQLMLRNFDIKVLDYITSNSEGKDIVDAYESAADSGLLHETQEKYGTNSVDKNANLFAVKENTPELEGLKDVIRDIQESYAESDQLLSLEKIKSIAQKELGEDYNESEVEAAYNEVAKEKNVEVTKPLFRNVENMVSRVFGKKPEDITMLESTDKMVEVAESLGGKAKFAIENTNKQTEAFYSPLEKFIESNPQNTFTPEQVLGQIKNLPQNEIEAIGLKDFLKDKTKVTKQELLDYVRDNKVNIEVVTKSDKNLEGEEKRLHAISSEGHAKMVEIQDKIAKGNTIYFSLNRGWIYKEPATERQSNLIKVPEEYIPDIEAAQKKIQDYEDFVERQSEDYPGSGREVNTKYSQYTLPGEKSNYREVLLTLPEKKIANEFEVKHDGTFWTAHNKTTNDVEFASKNKSEVEKYIAQTSKKLEGTKTEKVNFRSSHFDEPNVVAHIRLTDRVTPDGKKILFVEESQSDHARELRKQADENLKRVNNEFDSIVTHLKDKGLLKVIC